MNSNNRNSNYRKGVIMGLTMAEIMILVVFLLLLTFASLLKKEKEKYDSAVNLLKDKDGSIEKIVDVLSSVPPDMTEELTLNLEKIPLALKLIKENKLQEEGESSNEVIVRGIETLVVDQKLSENTEEKSITEQLKDTLADNVQLKSEVADLRGQNKSLIKQILGKGNGLTFPSCWTSSSGTHAEYIWNIDLTSDGIIIHNNNLPHRVEAMKELPLEQISYETLVSPAEFGVKTAALLELSKARDCRFYVRVYDKTAPGEKGLYKKLLEAVEGTFYKALM